jgi:hypothetical protein
MLRFDVLVLECILTELFRNDFIQFHCFRIAMFDRIFLTTVHLELETNNKKTCMLAS